MGDPDPAVASQGADFQCFVRSNGKHQELQEAAFFWLYADGR